MKLSASGILTFCFRPLEASSKGWDGRNHGEHRSREHTASARPTFECNRKDFSDGTDVLCELTTDRPTWCNASPSKRKLAASAWRWAAEKGGDCSRMPLARQSLLVEVGWILHVAEKKAPLGSQGHCVWLKVANSCGRRVRILAARLVLVDGRGHGD